jgi:hypothetical protein
VRKPIAALFAALTFLAACEVLPPAVAQTDPARIIVVGDSVTEQAYGYLGGWQGAPGDVVKVSGSGWDLDDAEGPYAAAVADGVDITILALGPNDADPASGGWTLYDLVNFHDFLGTTVPADTCVVVELPRHKTGTLFPSGGAWATQLDEARADLIDLASPGGHTAPPYGPVRGRGGLADAHSPTPGAVGERRHPPRQRDSGDGTATGLLGRRTPLPVKGDLR